MWKVAQKVWNWKCREQLWICYNAWKRSSKNVTGGSNPRRRRMGMMPNNHRSGNAFVLATMKGEWKRLGRCWDFESHFFYLGFKARIGEQLEGLIYKGELGLHKLRFSHLWNTSLTNIDWYTGDRSKIETDLRWSREWALMLGNERGTQEKEYRENRGGGDCCYVSPGEFEKHHLKNLCFKIQKYAQFTLMTICTD